MDGFLGVLGLPAAAGFIVAVLAALLFGAAQSALLPIISIVVGLVVGLAITPRQWRSLELTAIEAVAGLVGYGLFWIVARGEGWL